MVFSGCGGGLTATRSNGGDGGRGALTGALAAFGTGRGAGSSGAAVVSGALGVEACAGRSLIRSRMGSGEAAGGGTGVRGGLLSPAVWWETVRIAAGAAGAIAVLGV